MADKMKSTATVDSQVMLSDGIYSMWLKFPKEQDVAGKAVPGQFISMYCKEGSRLLPRPISICEINKEESMLRVVYRIAGQGTKEFSMMQAGDTIEIVGPLGNGFVLKEGKNVLIGGGIGIPPMLALAKALKKDVTVVLGYPCQLSFKSQKISY